MMWLSVAVWASSGGKVGVSEAGCSCHALASPGTVAVAFASSGRVGPGSTVEVALEVSTTNPAWTWAGMNVACSDGTLIAGFNTDVSNGELTHRGAQFLTGGAVSFAFRWQAPSSDGPVTCTAVANAVDLNGTTSGDGYAFAPDLLIEVDAACTDTDGDGVDTCNGDCDDARASVFTGAPESCDLLDNDCDGTTDEEPTDPASWYLDADADGFGGAGAPVLACDAPSGHVLLDGDCNDGDAADNPAAFEVCDGEDDDCDGSVDEADALDALVFYLDADLDGYGNPTDTTAACSVPAGYSVRSDDCDDDDGTVFPGSAEVWYDHVDQDCSGGSDFDQDGDGVDRDPPGQDCYDTDPSAYPGAPDLALDCVDDEAPETAPDPDAAPTAQRANGCGCDAGAAPTALWLLAIPALGRRRRPCSRSRPARPPASG